MDATNLKKVENHPATFIGFAIHGLQGALGGLVDGSVSKEIAEVALVGLHGAIEKFFEGTLAEDAPEYGQYALDQAVKAQEIINKMRLARARAEGHA